MLYDYDPKFIIALTNDGSYPQKLMKKTINNLLCYWVLEDHSPKKNQNMYLFKDIYIFLTKTTIY